MQVRIIKQLPSGGRQDVKIEGFAQVFISDSAGGNNPLVKAIFVRVVNPKAVWGPLGGGSDYGMRTPKLTQ